ALHDDEFTGLHAALNDPHGADTVAHFDRAHVYLVALSHHRQLKRSLKLVDRSLGNQQRILHGFGGGAHAPELTWPQDVVGVRKSTNDANTSRGDVYLAICVKYLALLGVNSAIRQN